MPASSLFLINPLGDLLEICCRSEMSRFSSKCCDHVEKTQFLAENHRLYFYYFLEQLPDGVNYPEQAFRSSLPAAGSYHSGSLRPR
jgi:hypothetical protein